MERIATSKTFCITNKILATKKIRPCCLRQILRPYTSSSLNSKHIRRNLTKRVCLRASWLHKDFHRFLRTSSSRFCDSSRKPTEENEESKEEKDKKIFRILLELESSLIRLLIAGSATFMMAFGLFSYLLVYGKKLYNLTEEELLLAAQSGKVQGITVCSHPANCALKVILYEPSFSNSGSYESESSHNIAAPTYVRYYNPGSIQKLEETLEKIKSLVEINSTRIFLDTQRPKSYGYVFFVSFFAVFGLISMRSGRLNELVRQLVMEHKLKLDDIVKLFNSRAYDSFKKEYSHQKVVSATRKIYSSQKAKSSSKEDGTKESESQSRSPPDSDKPTFPFSNFEEKKFRRFDGKNAQNPVFLKDVAGLEAAKEEVVELIDYLKNPKKFETLGGKIIGGVLFTGPPGCGKTLLAKAVAYEAEVPFFAASGSEFHEMTAGTGAKNVRKLFSEAEQVQPCIVFIDEIDTIGKKRGANNALSISETDMTLNQLLVNMDGVKSSKGILVMASTNRPEVLDPALVRRFTRRIDIGSPNHKDRLEILRVHIKKIKVDKSIDIEHLLERMASLTVGMTGADLAKFCNEAAVHAGTCLRDSVLADDFEFAAEKIILGVTNKHKIRTETEKKMLAYYEAGKTIVSWMLKHTDPLLKVSVIPRESSFSQAISFKEDKYIQSYEMILDEMTVILAGRLAEIMIFKHTSFGGEEDMQKVRQKAMDMVLKYGMSRNIGPMAFPSVEETGRDIYSDFMKSKVEAEARLIVAQANQRAQKILNQHLTKLHKFAKILIEKEVMNYSDIENFLGPRPLGRKLDALKDPVHDKLL